MIETIRKSVVPQAKGTSSPVAKIGDFICISGQLPYNADGTLVSDDITLQARKCIENMDTLLREMELDLRYVMSVRIYMTDIRDIDKVNLVFNEMFSEPRPARSCIGVSALQDNAKIQIEANAIDTRALEVLCASDDCSTCDSDGMYCQTDWS